MKKLGILVKVAIQSKLIYTKAFWFNLFGTTISILIYYYFWKYAFQSQDQISGFTATQMTTYVILARTLSSQFSEGINKEMAEWITKGNIIVELLRPVSLIYNLFSKKIGETLFFFLFKGLPIVFFSCLFLKGIPPQGILNFILFLISNLFSVIILFWIEFMVGMISFYTISSNGLALAKSALLTILSGGIVPIILFPKAIAQVLNVLPFAGMVSVPVNIYLGKYDLTQALNFMEIQILWIILLGIFSVVIYRRAIKKIIVQGG